MSKFFFLLLMVLVLLGCLFVVVVLFALFLCRHIIVRYLLLSSGKEVEKSENAIRLGILGVSSICINAVILPCRKTSRIVVYGVASRDEQKAGAFANRFNIPHFYGCYEDLIGDPNVDVVYIGLPNAFHHTWSEKAMLAGKHVLCEKPLCSNEDEALSLLKLQKKTHKILMEGMHWQYHPAAVSMKNFITSGEIGKIVSISASLELPASHLIFGKNDIRYDKNLAGGCLMDFGVYCVSAMRYFTDEEPLVREAVAEKMQGIDMSLDAKYDLPNCKGRGYIFCSFSRWKLNVSVRVEGELGSLFFFNFVSPHLLHYITLKKGGETKTYRYYHAGNTTYEYQLSHLLGLLDRGYSDPTIGDSVKNMKIIDETYARAGMSVRMKKNN